MSIKQTNAIKTRLWLGGKFAARDPFPVQLSRQRFEKKTRTSNLAVRVDRCFTMEGMPNVRNRTDFALPWNDLRESNLLEHVDILSNIGQPFGLGVWKHETDVFDGDGERLRFFLQRRQLLPSVTPPLAWPEYPTRVVLLDKSYGDPTAVQTELTVVQKTHAEIDLTDPPSGEAWVESDGHLDGNLWVSTLRLNVAQVPPDLPDCLLAIYLPYYQVVVESEGQRSYAEPLMEPRSLRLGEFG